MKTYVKSGWSRTVQHFPVIAMLFLYQLLWGFFLFRAVEGVLVPLLKRYPDPLAAQGAVQLFLIEAQFQVMKTDVLVPYLWALGGLFAVRMLLTPVINAGLFYSLQHATPESGTKFFAGVRAAWGKVAAVYAAELLLMFAPLVWLVPLVARALAASDSWPALGLAVVPALACWLLGCLLIRLLSLGMQFGAAAGEPLLPSLRVTLRSLLPGAAAALAVWGIGLLVGLASSAASIFLAGLFALILHQAHHFFRTWFKVWMYASQVAAWQSKR